MSEFGIDPFQTKPAKPLKFEFQPFPKEMPKAERALIDYHRSNLTGGTFLEDDQGITTVFLTGVQGPDGKEYLVPGYFDGKRQTPDAAWERANKLGWKNFPAYDSVEAADEAVKRLHTIIEADSPFLDQ